MTPTLGPPPSGLKDIEDLVSQLISVSVGLAFIALLVVLVIAGIKFITSGGEAKILQNASLTITWAILGILFLINAWLFLQLIRAFTGVDVTMFDIKTLCVGDVCLPK